MYSPLSSKLRLFIVSLKSFTSIFSMFAWSLFIGSLALVLRYIIIGSAVEVWTVSSHWTFGGFDLGKLHGSVILLPSVPALLISSGLVSSATANKNAEKSRIIVKFIYLNYVINDYFNFFVLKLDEDHEINIQTRVVNPHLWQLSGWLTDCHYQLMNKH